MYADAHVIERLLDACLLQRNGICVTLSSGAQTHLPSTPYDTLCVVPHNNPEFHVECTHSAGGVHKQTKRLYESTYIE